MESICVKYFLKDSSVLPHYLLLTSCCRTKTVFQRCLLKSCSKKIQNIDRKSYMVVNFLISKDTLKDFFPSHF